MSIPLMLIVTAIYVYVSWSELMAGRHGMAMTWVAYALANIGMIWNIMQQTRAVQDDHTQKNCGLVASASSRKGDCGI